MANADKDIVFAVCRHLSSEHFSYRLETFRALLPPLKCRAACGDGRAVRGLLGSHRHSPSASSDIAAQKK